MEFGVHTNGCLDESRMDKAFFVYIYVTPDLGWSSHALCFVTNVTRR